jgi:hypothetical protein
MGNENNGRQEASFAGHRGNGFAMGWSANQP